MKHLIIIGAGNIGKITCEYARLSKDFNVNWEIRGFLDFAGKEIREDKNYPAVIGTLEDYVPQADDLFICSFASVEEREKSVKIIEGKNGQFINIIHPSANICQTARIGTGNLIGAFTTVSVHANIGNHVIIQDHCNIGHDSVIGDFAHLYVGNIVCGINQIGRRATLYTGSTVYPKIKIGAQATVGAGSVVMRAVKENTTVFGNPAKKID